MFRWEALPIWSKISPTYPNSILIGLSMNAFQNSTHQSLPTMALMWKRHLLLILKIREQFSKLKINIQVLKKTSKLLYKFFCDLCISSWDMIFGGDFLPSFDAVNFSFTKIKPYKHTHYRGVSKKSYFFLGDHKKTSMTSRSSYKMRIKIYEKI